MKPETKITVSIIAHLKRLRAAGEAIWWVKLHGGPMQRAGLPDLIVIYQRRLFAIEIKRPGGTATALQQHTLDEMRDAGAVALVATCVEDVQQELITWKNTL